MVGSWAAPNHPRTCLRYYIPLKSFNNENFLSLYNFFISEIIVRQCKKMKMFVKTLINKNRKNTSKNLNAYDRTDWNKFSCANEKFLWKFQSNESRASLTWISPSLINVSTKYGMLGSENNLVTIKNTKSNRK